MATKKITITLENAPDCVLAQETIEVDDSEEHEDEIDHAIQDTIGAWTLSPGDTIKIGPLAD